MTAVSWGWCLTLMMSRQSLDHRAGQERERCWTAVGGCAFKHNYLHACATGTCLCYWYMSVLLVHVCATGTCLCYWYMSVLLVHVCATGTCLCYWYMSVLLVHVCATGTCLCYWYMSVLLVHVCATGTCLCYWYMYVLLVHVCATGTCLCYWYMSVLLVHVCATGTCLCHWYMSVLLVHVCATGTCLCYWYMSVLLVHVCVCKCVKDSIRKLNLLEVEVQQRQSVKRKRATGSADQTSSTRQKIDLIIFQELEVYENISHCDWQLDGQQASATEQNTTLQCALHVIHFFPNQKSTCEQKEQNQSCNTSVFSSPSVSSLRGFKQSVFWCQVCGLSSSAVILCSFHLRGIDSYSELPTASSQINPAPSAAWRDEASWRRLAEERAQTPTSSVFPFPSTLHFRALFWRYLTFFFSFFFYIFCLCFFSCLIFRPLIPTQSHTGRDFAQVLQQGHEQCVCVCVFMESVQVRVVPLHTHTHISQPLAAAIGCLVFHRRGGGVEKVRAGGCLLIACTFPSSSGSIKARPPSRSLKSAALSTRPSTVRRSRLPATRQPVSLLSICGVPPLKLQRHSSYWIDVRRPRRRL